MGLGAALPFFGNELRDFNGLGGFQRIVDQDGIYAPAGPAEQTFINNYVSSSASDYDSTPSDGGGDTNPTTPTAGPGGSPTQGTNL